MKTTKLILAFIFLIFAILQYNDPDPFLWIIAYVYVAILLILSVYGVANAKMIYGGIAGYLVWLIILSPDFISWLQSGTPSIVGKMQASKPEIELVREFLGLILCLSTTLFVLLTGSRNKN